jgi:hypothetical protein
MPDLPDLKVGEWVHWVSQANGSVKYKQGLVFKLVAPGQLPYELLSGNERSRYNAHAIDPRTLWRGTASVIVRVPTEGNSRAKDKLYWPRLESLRRGRGNRAGV